MKHSEVTKKWYGKNFMESESLGYQCVAWAKKYCEERGYPIGYFGGSAVIGWYYGTPFNSSWERIIYNGKNYPSEGDIVFFSEKRCADGHVAVANKFCNRFLLRYSDQNGSGKQDKIQPRWSSYSNVLGWFTKKK